MTQVMEPPAHNNGMAETTRTSTTAAATASPRPSKGAFVAGWILSGIVILWMGVLGIVIVLTNRAMMMEGMTQYGYPSSAAIPILVVELICVALYAIPRTAVLGAILLTGYLGGAVATHVRAGEPWFFPVIFGALVWLGLYLRDRRLRALVPLREV